MRPTDQETIAIEKIACYSSQEEGAAMLHRATQGSTRVSQEIGMRGESFIVVPVERNRQNKISTFRSD